MLKLPLILSAFMLIVSPVMADVASEAEELAKVASEDANASKDKSQELAGDAASALSGAYGSVASSQQSESQEVDSENK